MAVTLTPNIGLAKPDETELASDWARGAQLADDNNVILTSKMNLALTTYTPTIIGAGGNPTLGTGSSAVVEYFNFQNFISGTFIIQWGTAGVATGTGTYGISLPFPVDGAFHTVGTSLADSIGVPSCIGECYLYDDSSVGNSTSACIDVVTIAGVSYMRLAPEFTGAKTTTLMSSTSPFVPAINDCFSGSFCYKKA